MDDSIRLLQLYTQPAWHEDAWIVGNRPGLEALVQAIQNALSSGEGAAEVFAADGEGFTLRVRLDNAPMSSPSWMKRAMPYTDESAREHRPEAVWPEETNIPTLKVRVHLFADSLGFEQDTVYPARLARKARCPTRRRAHRLRFTRLGRSHLRRADVRLRRVGPTWSYRANGELLGYGRTARQGAPIAVLSPGSRSRTS